MIQLVDTETNQPAAPGKVGNLIATVFHRQVMPAIRFNLRDLARMVSTERCDCGSYFRRMDHFLGRSDNMVRLRGVNVYPMACLPAVRSDARTTGEWLCEAYTENTSAGPARSPSDAAGPPPGGPQNPAPQAPRGQEGRCGSGS